MEARKRPNVDQKEVLGFEQKRSLSSLNAVLTLSGASPRTEILGASRTRKALQMSLIDCSCRYAGGGFQDGHRETSTFCSQLGASTVQQGDDWRL